MRKTGTVIWFDSAKGFGSLRVEGVGDVLLHRTVVEAAGITSIREGAALDCEIVHKPKGPQVGHIYAVLDPGPEPPVAIDDPPTLHRLSLREPEPSGPLFEAECKWFSRAKGYGFVAALGHDGRHFRAHGPATQARHARTETGPTHLGASRTAAQKAPPQPRSEKSPATSATRCANPRTPAKSKPA